MTFEAVRLQSWYGSPQGRTVAHLVGDVLERWIRDNPSRCTLGFGFFHPYMNRLQRWTGHTLGASPAEMGVLVWPTGKPNRTCQTRPDALPFPDTHFDRVVMIHLLEGCHAMGPVLRETWRVLTPGGRLLVLVPNRGGLWARRSSFFQ